jgi:hypothetical protein
VATRTDDFQSIPTAALSTYALVAASCAEVGSRRFVIFWLFNDSEPEGAVMLFRVVVEV